MRGEARRVRMQRLRMNYFNAMKRRYHFTIISAPRVTGMHGATPPGGAAPAAKYYGKEALHRY